MKQPFYIYNIYIKIWNHPIEATIYKGCLGFQVIMMPEYTPLNNDELFYGSANSGSWNPEPHEKYW